MEAHAKEYATIIKTTKSLVDKTDLSGIDPTLYKKIKNIPNALPVVKKIEDIPEYHDFRNIVQLLYSVPNPVLENLVDSLHDLEKVLENIDDSYNVIVNSLLDNADLTKINKSYLDPKKYGNFVVDYIKAILAHNRSETNSQAYIELERIKTDIMAEHSDFDGNMYTNSTYNFTVVARYPDLKTLITEYFRVKGSLTDVSREFAVDISYRDMSSPVFYDSEKILRPFLYPSQYGLNPEIIEKTRTIGYVSPGSPDKDKTITDSKNTSIVFIIKYHEALTALMGISGNPIIPKTYFTSLYQPNPRVQGYNTLLNKVIIDGIGTPITPDEERESAQINYNTLATDLLRDISAAIETDTPKTAAGWLATVLDTISKGFYSAFSNDNSPEIALTLYHVIDYSLTNLLNIVTEKWADVGKNIMDHPDPKRYAMGKISEIVQTAVREITRKNDNIYSIISVKQQLIN